eukprot:4857996-Lingulodinium_polyedra.AAC.1
METEMDGVGDAVGVTGHGDGDGDDFSADTSPGLHSHARAAEVRPEPLSAAQAMVHDPLADVTCLFLEARAIPQPVHRENVNSLVAAGAEDGGVELAAG